MTTPNVLSGFHPRNPEFSDAAYQALNAEFPDLVAVVANVIHLQWSAAEAVVADTDAVHAAITDTGSAQVVTTGFTDPPCPRSITLTSGGTSADIGAIQGTIYGTDINGNEIEEIMPIFTANSATTVESTKMYATVTQLDLPAHDGTSATTSVGYGEKLALPYKFKRNTCLFAFRNNTKEGTAPTVGVHATDLEKNYIDLNSALNGTVVDAYFLHSGV